MCLSNERDHEFLMPFSSLSELIDISVLMNFFKAHVINFTNHYPVCVIPMTISLFHLDFIM